MIMCVTLSCLCFTNLYLQGKTNNFAHPALKEATIEFFTPVVITVQTSVPTFFKILFRCHA